MKIIRFLLLFIHLPVVLLLCLMLLIQWLPASLSTYPNLLSLAFPLLMFIHVFITLFWIFSWKKRAFFFLLISVLFFNATRRWINYSPAQPEGRLKVLTLNTKGGRLGAEPLKDYLQQHAGYDFVFLQEDQSEPFNNNVTYGITKLCTPHRILKHEAILNDNAENASAFYADVDVEGKTIRVINVYLEPFRFEKSMVKPSRNSQVNEEKARNIVRRLIPTFKIHQKQVEKIRQCIQSSPYPVIVAGDFNSVPNSHEYFTVSSGLNDAFLDAGRGSATSFHDYKFPIRIDYIFASPLLKAKTYRVDRSAKISDHYPVTATFDFN